jgi:hypothetical protein
MAEQDQFTLSQADVDFLKKLRDEHERRNINTPNRFEPPEQEVYVPDIYIAHAITGVPALTGTAGTGTGTGYGDIPGAATLGLFKLGGDGQLHPLHYTRKVYNLSTTAIPAGWVVIERDKWGTWLVSNPQSASGGGGGSSGALDAVQLSDGAGGFTNAATLGSGRSLAYDPTISGLTTTVSGPGANTSKSSIGNQIGIEGMQAVVSGAGSSTIGTLGVCTTNSGIYTYGDTIIQAGIAGANWVPFRAKFSTGQVFLVCGAAMGVAQTRIDIDNGVITTGSTGGGIPTSTIGLNGTIYPGGFSANEVVVTASDSSLTTVTPVANGTYTTGAALNPGVGVNGTITITSGVITAIQQAT